MFMVNFTWSLTSDHFIGSISSYGTDLTVLITNLRAGSGRCGNSTVSILQELHSELSISFVKMKKKKKKKEGLYVVLGGRCLLVDAWLMIHYQENSQWSPKQALSVLIRGLGPSSTPDPVSSVHWLMNCGNKLPAMFVNLSAAAHTAEMWASNDCISVCNEVWSSMINI